MATYGDRPAVVSAGGVTTYDDVRAATEMWARRLDDNGIGAGLVVGVIADFSPDACALLLALLDVGAIVVPLTVTNATHHDEFLGLATASAVFRLGADGEWAIERRDHTVTNEHLLKLIERSHPGLVVFSSGTTGASKGMVHDGHRLLLKFRIKRQGLVTLTFLLFDHLGGINTLLYTLSNGGTVVTTQDRDPEAVCALVERHRVQLLPVSPTFLGLLLMSGAHRRHDLSSLELITYGTEVMPQTTLDRIREEFPHLRLQQTYGLSEVGVLRTKSREDGSLWLKVGGEGVETKIVDGRLHIRSEWAMLGYINAPDPFDEDGWFDTQDEVEVDGEFIKILGRDTDIINVGGNKVYPAQVESALLEIDHIVDAVAFGEPNPITGQIVAAQVVLDRPESGSDVLRRVRRAARDRLERFMIPARIEVVERTEVGDRFKKVRAGGRRRE
ncbi:MAG: long-chain fatty acid--CoA ligase [Ilumatobacter sp.]|nr:long-chain fatty acid--CoA ligase [Ilumatobacter sp.]